MFIPGVFFVCNYGTLNSVDSYNSAVQYSRSNFAFCSSIRSAYAISYTEQKSF